MPDARSAISVAGARRRLVYVVHSLDPGGTERLATDMALAFREEYDVRVICLDIPGLWADTLRRAGIPVHCVYRQAGLDPAVSWRIAALARRWDASILHAHQCTPWFYAALSRLLYPAPRLLFEEHGRFHPETSSTARILVNRLLIRRLTHAFVAVSADVRERLVRYEGLRREDIDVIYNGVSARPAVTSQERASLRASLGATPQDLLIGTIGRFDAIKNLPMLVRAFAEAAANEPRLRLILIGDGPERSRIETLLAEMGVQGRVLLTGFRDDARRLAAALDLFVLSSFSEGTSMALLEAMSAGVPATVTAVGGNPEIVQDGITGWTVASDDAAALSRVLLALVSNPATAARRGAAAFSTFEERFTFDRMIERYRQQYRTLLGEQSGVLPHAAKAS